MDGIPIEVIGFALFVLISVISSILSKKNKGGSDDFDVSPPPPRDRDVFEDSTSGGSDPWDYWGQVEEVKEQPPPPPPLAPVPQSSTATATKRYVEDDDSSFWSTSESEDTLDPLAEQKRELERIEERLAGIQQSTGAVGASSSQVYGQFPGAAIVDHSVHQKQDLGPTRALKIRREIVNTLKDRATLQQGFLFSEIFGPPMGVRQEFGPRDHFWDR